MNEFWFNVRKITILALPVMLGSAGQNVIALTDSLFLYKYNENDFAAVGFASVFYLIIAAIAFGFSKGGQIIIARKYGEKAYHTVKNYFWAIIIFEAVIGFIIFMCIYLWAKPILSVFINSEIILTKTLEFLKYRSYGIPFSYVGLALISFYLGISRPVFILIDTLILGILNLFFCYVLVFGKFGFPEMGIAGAGLASAFSEAIAFIVFVVFMLFDKKIKDYHLLSGIKLDFNFIKSIFTLSLPILLQTIIGIASWFAFFSLIEKLGEHALAISNVIRVVYLVLSIPCWGFGTAINSVVSKTIGQGKEARVMNQITHSSIVAFVVTSIFAFPFLIFPNVFLEPILGTEYSSLFKDSIPYLKLLFPILIVYSFATVFFNGVSGTGATVKCLFIQLIASLFYLLVTYFATLYPEKLGLYCAWAAELVYWFVQLVFSFFVLKFHETQSKNIKKNYDIVNS